MRKILYLLTNFFKIPRFIINYYKFEKISVKYSKRFVQKFREVLPIFKEDTVDMGFDHHYVYHTAWAAKVLRELDCKSHYDFSSSLMFCSIISAFMEVHHYDYRAPDISLDNLYVGTANLVNLPFESNSVESLSCMHVIEHIGLGRYGDTLDPEGDLKAAKELIRILRLGGYLLMVVPMGEESIIRFNAHRIYNYQTLVNMFQDLDLVEFTFWNDKSDNFKRHSDLSDIKDSEYGCGCFVFRKPKKS